MTPASGIAWVMALVTAVVAFLGLVAAVGLFDAARKRGRVKVRPVWRQDLADAGYRVAKVGGFYIEVYRLLSARWGWQAWSATESVYSWQRRGSRRFRFLAVRDALREIAGLRGGRP
jgi:hypothetical protein